jgi:hypothetical protein
MHGIVIQVATQNLLDSINVEHQLPRWTDSQVDHRQDVQIVGIGQWKISKSSVQSPLLGLQGGAGMMPDQRHDRLWSTSAL